jgi:DNA mismatch repair protein MutS
MSFYSILFENPEQKVEESEEAPGFFVDLNLDQIIEAVTLGKQEYNLKPIFHVSLKSVDAVQYRHEVLKDLENPSLFEAIESFAKKMRTAREHLLRSKKVYYKYEKARWFLDAVDTYCDAVGNLVRNLSSAGLKSRGFLAFREYITNYAGSGPFTSLLAETAKLKADLSAIRYCMLINGNAVTVQHCEAEVDYSAEVEATFAKFKQGAVRDYRAKFSGLPDLNDAEARILAFVAKLYPEIFESLDDYCSNNRNYLDQTIGTFDREIQFYVAYLDYVEMLERGGLKFCYPKISATSKAVYCYETFDSALAYKLMRDKGTVVCNDFYLKDNERIFVISGPNQGGKTTFARTFGQLHYLASTGCPVPGRVAQLFLFDRLFTHFEREETIQYHRGKLQDDLVRIHEILDRATSNSVIIMNEMFTSTTFQDALLLSEKIIEQIIERDLLAVWVTFIDELASFAEQTVSMVSTVVPKDPALRTYKLIRRPADGLAYAMSIAEKYGVTYEHLRERIRV